MGEQTSYRRRFAVVISIPVLILLAQMNGFFGWSDLNSVHEDVDIATGRIRRTRYLLYGKISESVENSMITQSLSPERLAVAQPEWHRVNTFCGLNHVSPPPHYAFHGAIRTLDMLSDAYNLVFFTGGAKRQVAERVLQSWQSSQDYHDAADYVPAVYQKAIEYHMAGKTSMEADDLPRSQGVFTSRTGRRHEDD